MGSFLLNLLCVISKFKPHWSSYEPEFVTDLMFYIAKGAKAHMDLFYLYVNELRSTWTYFLWKLLNPINFISSTSSLFVLCPLPVKSWVPWILNSLFVHKCLIPMKVNFYCFHLEIRLMNFIKINENLQYWKSFSWKECFQKEVIEVWI